MTQFLPPNLLSLFLPREPIPFKAPPKKKKCPKNKRYTGITNYIDFFDPPTNEPLIIIETRDERRERKRREKAENDLRILDEKKGKWDPKTDTNVSGNPYKTLIVARINYETTDAKLRREFEIFGPIRNISIVKNKLTGRHRGYAFIEFEHKRDMHNAYKHMDGKKIDGKRVIVDAERGRTERHWLPRYLGGGLGGDRRTIRSRSYDQEPEEHVRQISREVDKSRESVREKFKERSRGRDREGSDYSRKRRERSRDKESSRRNGSRHRSRSKHEHSHEKDSKKSRDRESHHSSRNRDSKHSEKITSFEHSTLYGSESTYPAYADPYNDSAQYSGKY